jgi:hypothetical protein
MFDDLLSDVMELTNSELDERIRANEMERRRLDAEQAALIAVADHRTLYADDEHRSINAYLRATLNCSWGEASRLRTVARAVDGIDGLGDALLSGRFGVSQVAQFTKLHGNRRVRDKLPAAVPLLLEHAEVLPFRDFVACVDRFAQLADADGAHDGRDDAVENRIASVVDVGGTVDITARGGDGVISAELIAIFDQFCEAEYRNDLEARRGLHGPGADEHPLPRTARQWRFDAMVSIFRTAAAAGKVGSAAQPLVNIVIDAASWARLMVAAGLAPHAESGVVDPAVIADLVHGDVPLQDRRCETSTGIQLHPHDVLRAALSGHVRRVVVDSAGVVIDLGRRQRLFTGAARDAAKLMVMHCEHPGCDLPAEWCDVDHQVEWAAGGATDQSNAGIQCGRHNVAKTRRRWRTRRSITGRNYTIRPDGTIVLPVGVRQPVFPSDDDDPDVQAPDEVTRLEHIARRRAAALAG